MPGRSGETPGDRAATATTGSALGYQPAFDGLRAVGVGLVLLFHYAGRPHGGALGVDLFFVLSGFLITVLLMEEWKRFGSISLARFYGRRGLRLLPALGVLIGVYLLLIPVLPSHSFRQALYASTYTTDVALAVGADVDPRIQPLWSLAVEEQFYLLWPVALLVLLRRGAGVRGLIALAGGCAIAIAVARYVLAAGAEPPGPAFWATRFDPILVGCCLGLAYSSDLRAKLRGIGSSTALTVLAVAGAVGLVVTTSFPGFVADGQSFAFALAAAVLVVGSTVAVPGAPRRFLTALLSTAVFVFVGRISYALYLWHFPMQWWFFDAGLDDAIGRPQTRILALAATFAVATLSYYLVEQRFLRLKWKLARVRSHDVSMEDALDAGRRPGASSEASERREASQPAPHSPESVTDSVHDLERGQ
jgi:peptidoglycan/LPS O-acetylase OafA/YrhL